MVAETSYNDWLKEDFGTVIDALDLTELQKHYLRSRWLEQVLWAEGKSATSQKFYHRLRLTTISGGVLVPALVSLKILPAAVVVSLIVAGSTAVEGFFQHGERSRHYRRTAEQLKLEGWQFFQLIDEYQAYHSHAAAYSTFASRVEGILQQDLETFMKKVAPGVKPTEDEDSNA